MTNDTNDRSNLNFRGNSNVVLKSPNYLCVIQKLKYKNKMNDFENILLTDWVKEMRRTVKIYREPVLDEFATNIIKFACDTFKQDLHVFFMSVDVAEEYISLKFLHKAEIKDPFLVVCVVVFIMGKFYGAQGADLKISTLEKFMLKLTGIKYDHMTIRKSEFEILQVMQCHLPSTTVLDDLDTFFENFTREYRLQEVLRPLCFEILIVVYCLKSKWFDAIKETYKDDLRTFEFLMGSKLYLPSGILITAFKKTNYYLILDIEGLLEDLSAYTNIAPRHVHTLSSSILSLMNS